MSNESYKKAIDVLMGLNPDKYREVIIEIAKSNPTVLVNAAKSIGFTTDPDWLVAAKKMAKDGASKIEVIRKIREMTGMSLYDAKVASVSFGWEY